MLLIAGADVEAICINGTPLYIAAGQCDMKTIKLLLEKEANTDTVTAGEIKQRTRDGAGLEEIKTLIRKGSDKEGIATGKLVH